MLSLSPPSTLLFILSKEARFKNNEDPVRIIKRRLAKGEIRNENIRVVKGNRIIKCIGSGS